MKIKSGNIFDFGASEYYSFCCRMIFSEMWVRARNTFRVIDDYINSCYNEQSSSASLEQLMIILNKTRALFVDIFRNPVRFFKF